MHRVRYLVRAFFLLVGAVVPVVLGAHAFQTGVFESLDTIRKLNMVAGVLAVTGPLSVLLLRELVEVVWSPETREDWAMIASSRSESVALDLVLTTVRAPIGCAIFALAAAAGMQVFFGIGGMLLLVGWMIGFGERRLLVRRQRRQIFIEGYLLPDWIDLRRALATSVHMTRYRGAGGYTEYKAVLMTGPRTLVDLQPRGPTRDWQEAEANAQSLAARFGVPYMPNPEIEQQNRMFGHYGRR